MNASDASAGSGTPVLGNACALASGTPDTLPADVANCMRVVAFAKQLGLIGGERSVDATLSTAVNVEATEGKGGVARDDPDAEAVNKGAPSATVTESRQVGGLPVQKAPPEASDAEPIWPEESELFELGVAMLTGGNGEPAEPVTRFEPAKATYELFVRVKAAVKKLKEERGSEMHMIPGTTGRIDQQEGRGYLLGAVLGRGLLSRKQAAAAGLDARNKLTALEKRLAEQKETARRAAGTARRAGGGAIEKQAADAKTAREAIERERICLDLPLPLPPPPAQPVTGRKRAAPSTQSADPMQSRFETWCHRHHPNGVKDPVAYYDRQRKTSRLLRAITAHAWKPRTYAGRRDLAQTQTLQQRDNQLCTCDDDVPSILCRAHKCWAFEIGTCDGLRSYGGSHPSRRVVCDCMQHAYGQDPEQRWPEHKPQLMWDAEEDAYGRPGLHFTWLDPPPGGWYGPGYHPDAAARKLTTEDVRLLGSDDCPSIEKFPSYGKV